MAKRVIVVASGETERRSLPHLLALLPKEAISVADVRIPPRHRDLNAPILERILRAAYYEMVGRQEPPDKFVVLVDLDGKDSKEVLPVLRERLLPRVESLGVPIRFAFAQQHLEAWFFADPDGLRSWLARDLGKVDTSRPDSIRNPKLHLKHLLGDTIYTAGLAGEIARRVDPARIAMRSPSFSRLLEEIRNGPREEADGV